MPRAPVCLSALSSNNLTQASWSTFYTKRNYRGIIELYTVTSNVYRRQSHYLSTAEASTCAVKIKGIRLQKPNKSIHICSTRRKYCFDSSYKTQCSRKQGRKKQATQDATPVQEWTTCKAIIMMMMTMIPRQASLPGNDELQWCLVSLALFPFAFPARERRGERSRTGDRQKVNNEYVRKRSINGENDEKKWAKSQGTRLA